MVQKTSLLMDGVILVKIKPLKVDNSCINESTYFPWGLCLIVQPVKFGIRNLFIDIFMEYGKI